MTIDMYETWDASYVLGALSSTERREYESHLNGCERCRSAVADLSGMPALLALLDDELKHDTAAVSDVPPLRPEVLGELLAKVDWRRRRARWAAATAMVVAAVVMAVGVFIATRPGVLDPTLVPRATVSAMTMAPVPDAEGASEFAASFTMTRHDWGTDIAMTCTYSETEGDGDGAQAAAGSDVADKLAMVAVGRDGSHVQLGTWKARAGETAQTSGSTSMPIDEIAAVQVVSADTGDVLLQRNL